MKLPPEVGGRRVSPSPHFVPPGQSTPPGHYRVARPPGRDLTHYTGKEGLILARWDPTQILHGRGTQALPGHPLAGPSTLGRGGCFRTVGRSYGKSHRRLEVHHVLRLGPLLGAS
ncbi:unnamed protein product, partial [Musa textilis]